MQDQIVFDGEQTQAYIKTLGTVRTLNSLRSANTSASGITGGVQPSLRPSINSGPSHSQLPACETNQ